MIFFRLAICISLSLNIFAAENYIDSITLSKIKKLIEKEEEVAIAYKKYLLGKGSSITIPLVINNSNNPIIILKNDEYLPKGFNEENPFGKEIKLILDENSTTSNKKDDKHNIKGFETSDLALKSNLYDYYYSNKYRTHTRAPMGINNNNVEIILSPKEKFIYENSDQITIVKTDAISATASGGMYYLDEKGILHMYEGGKYKFSVAKDLIVDKDFIIFESDGKTVTENFKGLTSSVIFAGQNIIKSNGTSATDYIAIDEETIIVKNPEITLTTDKGLVHFGNQSGGMIVNGDIYTWGNNENRITGIDLDDYNKDSAKEGVYSVVINTLVRAKVKMYDDLSIFSTQNFFSSPLRPKFIDLFSDTMHGTCGITTKGELYCGGVTANNKTFTHTYVNTNDTINPDEMLYRSKYFDGSSDSKKAKKIIALNQLWLILGEDGSIYRWGTENTYKNGFSGNGTSTFNNSTTPIKVCIKWKKKDGSCKKYETQYVAADINKDPEKISTEIFSDITYIFTDGHKKVAALSTTGDIYIWGFDSENSENKCELKKDGVVMNLCTPTRITKDNSTLSENITFKSIKGGVNAFIALGTDDKYYKIVQPEKLKVQVSKITVPEDNLSVDLASNGTVVYVDADNKLISTYFTSSSFFDNTFRSTINSMLWKSIKVLEGTNNSMCGLNTDNQMYCWGIQSYTDKDTEGKNTFMLPVFNTNLYDSTKDYMIAEAGDESITNMTSGVWDDDNKDTDNKGAFVITYPTYIGGFNYEVIFK